jgi:hypothetical protein
MPSSAEACIGVKAARFVRCAPCSSAPPELHEIIVRLISFGHKLSELATDKDTPKPYQLSLDVGPAVLCRRRRR